MPAESLGECDGLFLASKFDAENDRRRVGAVSEQGWFDLVSVKPLPHLRHAFGESHARAQCAYLYREHRFPPSYLISPLGVVWLTPACSMHGQSSDTNPANSSAKSAASMPSSNCRRTRVPDPEITYSKTFGWYPRRLSHACISVMMSGSAIPR